MILQGDIGRHHHYLVLFRPKPNNSFLCFFCKHGFALWDFFCNFATVLKQIKADGSFFSYTSLFGGAC